MLKVKCVDKSGRCNSPFFEDQFLELFTNKFGRAASVLKSNQVVFDFDDVVWTDLLELMSVVGAMFYVSSSQDNKVSFHVTESPQSRKTIGHLSASGFFDLLRQLGIKAKTPELSTTDPYAFFRFTNISDYFEKEVARNLILDNVDYYYPWIAPSQRLSFDKIINEALDNTLEHAYNSPPLSVRPRMIAIRRFSSDFLSSNASYKLAQQSYWLRALLRYTQKCDFLEISIVDVGVGILERIRPELTRHIQSRTVSRAIIPSEVNDISALRFTLSGDKSTSSSIKEGKGYGLYKLKNHVQAWNGLFLIRSGRARLIYSPATLEVDERDNLRPFPGTQIRIMLPMADRRMNVEYILGRENELK